MKQQVALVVTEYVVLEIANALSRTQLRESAIKLVSSIRASQHIQVIEISKEIFEEAWVLYSSRLDKDWSLTDCASFIVMARNEVREAFHR